VQVASIHRAKLRSLLMLTLEDIMICPPPAGERLIFQDMFGDKQPVELEIGAGKGGFLLRRAKAMPDRRFLGVEWANKYCRYAADRMARCGIKNVRLMRTDARELVLRQLLPESIVILHIYHPDPWPKRRHHRRRLIQPDFIAAATDALCPGGRLAIQTDHAEYFKHIQEVVRNQKQLAEETFDVPEAGVIDGKMETNFEIKYLREGRAIYKMALKKIAISADKIVGGECFVWK